MIHKRILITGARAPVALDLARHFAESGHITYTADSVRFPLTRASRYIKKSFYLPTPNTSLSQYRCALQEIIHKYHIDLIIPTCEEIFYIAWLLPHLSQYCEVFCDHFDKLKNLHSKWQFTLLANNCGISIPKTFKLESDKEIPSFYANSVDFVFKPAYSRFASNLLISPTSEALKKHVHPTSQYPWVAQERIYGKEYCTYSIAHHGKIVASACYHPKYRVGPGSGVYFEPHSHPQILAFIKAFVKKIAFHGQIGFDFIETENSDLFVLECNPRATSGIHLFVNQNNFADTFFNANNTLIEANPARPLMVAPALLLFNLLNEFKSGKERAKILIQNFVRAKDVSFSLRDPGPAAFIPIGLLEILWRSLKNGVSIREAATADIEWNGQPLL